MNNLTSQQGFRLRVAYQKTGRLRFLSHLEIIRAVERMVRRAMLPYAITQGFSPHMKIAFATALPVGTASLEEYFDVTLTRFIKPKEALAMLKEASVPNLEIVYAAYVSPKAPSLTAFLTIHSYRAELCHGKFSCDQLTAAFEQVLKQGTLTRIHKGKKKEITLTDKIVGSVTCTPLSENKIYIDFTLRATQSGSLRPDLLFEAILAKLHVANYELLRVQDIQFTRIAQAGEDESGRLLSAYPISLDSQHE